ncbi:MAG: zinc ribbon domain-containing protein, partial [Clostridia bacterium]|nr:zinc ribbon domain-containing protein [Clostridia bacterium]
MFCKNCGQEIAEGNAFCMSCGAPVEQQAAAQPAQQYVDPQPVAQPAQQYVDPQPV